jgi:hypothetical protein
LLVARAVSPQVSVELVARGRLLPGREILVAGELVALQGLDRLAGGEIQ